MTKAAIDYNTKLAPAEAFAFASECKFESASDRDANGLRRMPIEVLARTGQPVYHWYWEWIVHDFAGMRSKSSVAFDYRHDPDEPIGYANKITAKNELRLGGELLSRSPDDEAARIMDLGPAGVPYESSIHFDHRNLVLEYLPDGVATTVNGNEVTGPLTIAREWELLRCAICLTGVDGGSQTNFSDESVAQFSLNWKDTNMAETGTKTPPAGKADSGKESESGKQSAETVSTETSTNVAPNRGQFEAELRNDLKRYVDRFGGEDGAKYFTTEGMTYEGALELHCTKLESALKEAVAGKAEAEEKLAKLDLGEIEGVNTGTPKKTGEKATTFESLHRAGGGPPAEKK